MRPHSELEIKWVSTKKNLEPTWVTIKGLEFVEIKHDGVVWIDVIQDGSVRVSINSMFVTAIGYYSIPPDETELPDETE